MGMHSLLSVRYYLLNEAEIHSLQFANLKLPEGFEKVEEKCGFGVYENENYLKMGTFFPSFMLRSEYGKLTEEEFQNGYSENKENFNAQCAALNRTAADTFFYDDTVLTLSYTDTEAGMVFLSIPYSSGFTAYADGKEIAIEVVDGGLMAVSVPAGTEKLELVYREPGLVAGVVCSMVGVVLFIIIIRKRKSVSS